MFTKSSLQIVSKELFQVRDPFVTRPAPKTENAPFRLCQITYSTYFKLLYLYLQQSMIVTIDMLL
jgi:hypothetical protein